jgi:hypothetical protein
MKKFLFSLIGLVLVGANTLFGQAPAPVIAPGSPGGCCCPAQVTCVPEQYTKKITKVEYGKGCEPLCLCFFQGCRRRCDCGSGHCEHPYTRHYLIKKVHTCEECATHCVPSQCPACGTGQCCGVTVATPLIGPAPAMAAPGAVMPMAPAPPTR